MGRQTREPDPAPRHAPGPAPSRQARPQAAAPVALLRVGLPLRPADVLALQRSVGNRAVLGILGARQRPPPVQRVVDATAARKDNSSFAAAEKVILTALAAANGELWQMINDEKWKVDLVIRSDLGITESRGETRPMAFYDQSKKARIEDLMHDGVDLKNERITIELQVVQPVLAFWDRTPGQAAGIVAHEYAVHAERFAKIIKHIRTEGSVGDAVPQLNAWSDRGEFDPDVHHASIFEHDEHTDRYVELIKLMEKVFLQAGMKSDAQAVVKAFEEDVSEHRMQARLTGNKHLKKKAKPSFAQSFRAAMQANDDDLQKAKQILATLSFESSLPTVQTLEDLIENA
jgi:hypothetical protein